MSSMFQTSGTLQHVTPIPAGIPKSKGVELLHDHDFYINCDPHMLKYDVIDAPSQPPAPIPEDRQVTAIAPTTSYRVTDKVHALPAGLWDSDVVSTYQFTKVETGVFVKIFSPLSTTMETLWHIRETKDGGIEIVEDVLIKCSRLLMGIVKNTCEAGWQGIHNKMVAKLSEGGS